VLSLRGTFQQLLKAGFMHHFDKVLRFMLISWVQIELDGAIEDHGLLGDDSNLSAESMQVDLAGFKSINGNRAICYLNNTSEG